MTKCARAETGQAFQEAQRHPPPQLGCSSKGSLGAQGFSLTNPHPPRMALITHQASPSGERGTFFSAKVLLEMSDTILKPVHNLSSLVVGLL